MGWSGPDWTSASALVSVSRHAIPSGASILDAIYVEPVGPPARAAVLLCHGIGETVRPWFPVQQLLAINGVASLLFDYSGYGKSTGAIDWTQFEQDAVAAFRCLEGLAHPLPVSVLGFSLGSGVAAAVINRLHAQRLILCAAFTSFRDATHAIGIPARLGPLVPPIWSAEESLRHCALPILIVHGARDRLFPVKMAAKLASLCGPNGKIGHRPRSRSQPPPPQARTKLLGARHQLPDHNQLSRASRKPRVPLVPRIWGPGIEEPVGQQCTHPRSFC